ATPPSLPQDGGGARGSAPPRSRRREAPPDRPRRRAPIGDRRARIDCSRALNVSPTNIAERAMTRIVDWYFRGLRMFIAACLAVMVVLVFGNVVLRYAFNSGITISEELSRWLFVWLTFVGAVVALRDHAHLGMDSVVSRMPAWGKKACFLLS